MAVQVCCGATAAKCWAEGYAPLTAKLREMLGPSAIIYANECLDIAAPELNVTEVPPNFDLISIDHYDGYLPGTNGSAEVEEARANYEVLFSKMHPWQRAVLLPGVKNVLLEQSYANHDFVLPRQARDKHRKS